MVSILVGAPILAIALGSFVPMLVVIAIVSSLAVRTAIRSQWKRAPLSTRLLHGLHSHLIQIPLLFGQLRYRLDHFRGKSAELIEYKDIDALQIRHRTKLTARTSSSARG